MNSIKFSLLVSVLILNYVCVIAAANDPERIHKHQKHISRAEANAAQKAHGYSKKYNPKTGKIEVTHYDAKHNVIRITTHEIPSTSSSSRKREVKYSMPKSFKGFWIYPHGGKYVIFSEDTFEYNGAKTEYKWIRARQSSNNGSVKSNPMAFGAAGEFTVGDNLHFQSAEIITTGEDSVLITCSVEDWRFLEEYERAKPYASNGELQGRLWFNEKEAFQFDQAGRLSDYLGAEVGSYRFSGKDERVEKITIERDGKIGTLEVHYSDGFLLLYGESDYAGVYETLTSRYEKETFKKIDLQVPADIFKYIKRWDPDHLLSLIKYNDNWNTTRTKYRTSPFIEIVKQERCNREVVKYCLSRGADPFDVYKTDILDNELSALSWAIGNNDVKTLALMIYSNPKGEWQKALGSRAVNIRSADVLKLLVPMGLDINAKDKIQTLLHNLASYGSLDAVRYAVESGADVNAISKNGRIPLHNVGISRSKNDKENVEIARLLLDNGSDLELKDKIGNTPIDWAKDKEKEALVTFYYDLLLRKSPALTGRRYKDIVKDKFAEGNVYIGGTTGWWTRTKSADGAVLDMEFSYVTPENDFKQSTVSPEPGMLSWFYADKWIDHCKKTGQVIRIHGPISPQCSRWVKDDSRTPEELETALRHFFISLCNRYNEEETVRWMDVVNETVLSDGKWHGPRKGTDSWECPWTLIGFDESDPLRPPKYIKMAFEIANEYAPNKKLIINQHGGMEPVMWDKIKELVKYLRRNGLRVDGIGWQAHVNTGFEKKDDNLKKLGELIDWAHANGLSFHITEANAWLKGKADFEEQADTFAAILKVLLERRSTGEIGWNTWNISDGQCWKPEWKGCLFFEGYKPKPAYYAIQNLLENPPPVKPKKDKISGH